MIDRLGRWAVLASFASLLACSSTSPTPEPGTSGALPATAPPATAPATASAAATASAPATATSASAAAAPTPYNFVDGVAWAPSGDRLVVWCGSTCKHPDDAPVPYHVADLLSGQVRTALIPAEGGTEVRGASFSYWGNFLVASAGNTIQVLKTADVSVVLKLEKTAVYGVMGLNPEETHFAWADAYGYAEVVDLATGKGLGTASLHDPNSGNNQGLAWLTGGRVVFSCNEGCTPELWGTKGKRIARLHIDGGPWGDLRVVATPGGSVLVADSNGQVGVFDGKDGKGSVLRKKDKAKPGELDLVRVAVALSGDARKLVVARTNGELTVFDLDTKKATTVLSAREGAASIERVAVSHDGSRIAFGDYETFYEVRAAEKATPEKLPGTPQAYSADGVLVVRGKDHVAGLVDGKEKWRRPLSNAALMTYPGAGTVALSKDRKVVAIPDGQLHLVRASDGKSVTLSLESKGNRTLVPQTGSTLADVAAVLGR